MNFLELSQTIRSIRQAQGMTVEQLAKKSGFSKGFISQVENFRQTPSLKALVRIADALGVSLSTLFTEPENGVPEYTFGQLDNGVEVERSDSEMYNIRYLALAYSQIGRRMDPFVIEYRPGEARDFLLHDTEEFFVLLEGELNYFLYDDSQVRKMVPGDTLYLKANIPHRVELLPGCSYARGLVVYTDPAVVADYDK